ncbi:hypothetical protein ABVT39_010251 [Epinephelus coioides]
MVGNHDAMLKQILEHMHQLTNSVTQIGGRLDSVADRLASSGPSTQPPAPPTLLENPPSGPTLQPQEPYIPIPASLPLIKLDLPREFRAIDDKLLVVITHKTEH